MVRLGQGSYVAIGEMVEGVGSPASTYLTNGTAIDMDVWFRATAAADNMGFERDPIKLEDVTTEWYHGEHVRPGQRRVVGSVTLMATWDGMQNLLRYVTGLNANPINLDSPASRFYWSYHQYDRLSPLHHFWGVTGRSLCIEVCKGGYYGSPKPESVYYQGCMVSEFQVRFEKNGLVEITLSFIGRGFTRGDFSWPIFHGSPAVKDFCNEYMSSPTGQLDSAFPFLRLPQATPQEIVRVHSCTITCNTGIEPLYDVQEVNCRKPLPSGKQTCTMDIEVERDKDDFLTRLDAPQTAKGGRFSACSLIFSRPNAVGANPYTFTWYFYNMMLTGQVESRAKSLGVVTAAVTLEALAVPAYAAWAVSVINRDDGYRPAHTPY